MQDTYNIFIDDKLVATSNDLHFTSDSLDLTNLVLVDERRNGNVTDYFYRKLVTFVSDLANALRNADVFSFEPFVSELKVRLSGDYHLSDAERFRALEYGGVNNWFGYEYAIECAEDNDEDWYDLSDSDKLEYLENAGVDNWANYSEAICGYVESSVNVEDATDFDIVRVYQNLPRHVVMEWENVDKFIDELYNQ